MSGAGKAYIAFCEEELWRPWKAKALDVPRPFDHEAMPEPYLLFDAGKKPLIALTTNPGNTMDHQLHSALKPGCGPVSEEDKYAEAARKLGAFYERKLAGRPAGDRIAKLLELSSRLGCEGMLQTEVFPFHSPSLPMSRKRALLREATIDKGGVVGRYIEHLRRFLHDLPVVIVQASNSPMEKPTSEWLTGILELAGLDDPESLERVPLVGTTFAAWVSEQPGKALLLKQGGTGLPASDGLSKLAVKLKGLLGSVATQLEFDDRWRGCGL